MHDSYQQKFKKKWSVLNFFWIIFFVYKWQHPVITWHVQFLEKIMYIQEAACFFRQRCQNRDSRSIMAVLARKKYKSQSGLKNIKMSDIGLRFGNIEWIGSWKRIVAHELQTTSRIDLLKNWVPDCSAQDRISAKSL